MSEPFLTPPPLGDDIEDRTRRLARRLKVRRRAGILASASLAMVLVVASIALANNPTHNGAQVHVAGVPGAATSEASTVDDSRHSSSNATSTTQGRSAPPKATSSTSSTSSGDRTTSHSITPSKDLAPMQAPQSTTGEPQGSVRPTTPPVTNAPGAHPTTTLPGLPFACPDSPPGATITRNATIQATAISTGKWHVTGTLTITNHSGFGYVTMGVVYLADTTIPGGTGEAYVGWNGDAQIAIGSGSGGIINGAVAVAPGQTVSVPMDQTVHVDGQANALTAGTQAPTTIHNSWSIGSIGRFMDTCPNQPTTTSNFSDGGPMPSYS